MRTRRADSIVLVVLASAGVANAQSDPENRPSSEGFGKRATTFFTLENVAGDMSISWSSGKPTSADSGLSKGTSALPAQSFGLDTSPSSAFMLWPLLMKIGVSGVVGSGVTLGVSLAPVYLSSDSEKDVVIDLRPRVGYAIPFGPLVGGWVRVGPNYAWFHTSQTHVVESIGTTNGTVSTTGTSGTTTTTDSSYALGAGIDALLVYTPVPHFGLMGGLTFDIPITGSKQDDGTKLAFATSGLTLGFVVDF